jgi:hypothetical protein
MADVALIFKERPYPGATNNEMLESELHISAATGVDPMETFKEDKTNSILAR